MKNVMDNWLRDIEDRIKIAQRMLETLDIFANNPKFSLQQLPI